MKNPTPPETIETTYYETRSQVASFFYITRMQLYRWEKVLRLPQYWTGKHGHIQRLTSDQLHEWFEQQRKEERKLRHAGRYPPQ